MTPHRAANRLARTPFHDDGGDVGEDRDQVPDQLEDEADDREPYRNWSISGSSPPRLGRREGLRRVLEAGLRPLEPEDPLDDRAHDQEEQDRRLQDADQIGGYAGLDLHRGGAGPHRSEQEGCEDDPDRPWSHPEQGHRDGVEPDGRPVRRRHRVGRAEQVGRAGDAAEHAGHGHRPDDEVARGHAGIAGGVRTRARDADLESARRPKQQPAVQDGHDRGVDDRDRPVAPEDDREGCVAHGQGGRRRGADDVEWPAHRGRQDGDGDEVQHDRGHDFVRSGHCLQEARDEAPGGAEDHPREQGERHGHERRALALHADDDRPEGAHQELSLWTPMLNSPALKPRPTARPPSRSGIVLLSVLTMARSDPTEPEHRARHTRRAPALAKVRRSRAIG